MSIRCRGCSHWEYLTSRPPCWKDWFEGETARGRAGGCQIQKQSISTKWWGFRSGLNLHKWARSSIHLCQKGQIKLPKRFQSKKSENDPKKQQSSKIAIKITLVMFLFVLFFHLYLKWIVLCVNLAFFLSKIDQLTSHPTTGKYRERNLAPVVNSFFRLLKDGEVSYPAWEWPHV